MAKALETVHDLGSGVFEGVDCCGTIMCAVPVELTDDNDVWGALRDVVVDRDKTRTTEKKVILSDLYYKLSSEANEVVQIVLDAPEELAEYMAGKVKQKCLTLLGVRDYLCYIGWRKHTIDRTFRELKKFVKNF